MDTKIQVENGDVLAAVRSFLRRLMEDGIVEALLVPLETDHGTIIPGLVTDPAQLSLANPLAPVMPINNARSLAALTGKSAPAEIGAVIRPCEIHAFIELVKLQQATLEGVILISMDCPGTYEVKDYQQYWQKANGSLAAYLSAACEGQDPAVEGLSLRKACQICTGPVPENVAVHFHWFGCDSREEIHVTVWDQIAQSLGLPEEEQSPGDSPAVNLAALERLVSNHAQQREKELQAVRAVMSGDGGLAELFETCIRCHNCKTACPICYCKTCLFESESFRHDPGFYINAARHRGVLRMLPDTMLFHLTRMSHMSLSCVGCGMCTSACPMDIPVGTIFMAVGSQVQAVFGYQPGRNAEEALPLISYQPAEWVEVGEER